MRLLLLLFASTACAAASKPETRTRLAEPVYDRILGANVATPEMVIYLDPVLAERYFDGSTDDAGFARVVAAFERIGARRGEASARLNWGAVLWKLGREEDAYREISRALTLFVRVGDVQGMAHTHEWLGHTMLSSGAIEQAGEHLAVAYQLFEKLGNQAASERVLSYGE